MITETTKAAREVFNYFTDDLSLSFDTDSAGELLYKLDTDTDFSIDIDGEEYRVIHDDVIEGIWEESLRDLLEECYEIPDFLANYIDYDAWVSDCKVDGMGHHFAGYDGEEHGVADWYMFRTN
jgi:hypothetical protein